MKETKINYASIITSLVFTVIFVAGAITLFVLPSEIFDDQSTQIIFGALTALFAFLFFILTITTYNKERKRVAYVNELLALLGDNALVFNGRLVDKEASRDNAKKTAISVAIATVFAAIFGFGVFRVSGNENPSRLFIVSDEGLLIINPRSLEKRSYPIGQNNQLKAVNDKNGQVKIETSLNDYYYLIKTNKTDVSQDWLQNRLNDLFKQQTRKTVESPFEEV